MRHLSFTDGLGLAVFVIACSSEEPAATFGTVAGSSGAASGAGSSGGDSASVAGAGPAFGGSTSLGGGGSSSGGGGSVDAIAGTSVGGGGSGGVGGLAAGGAAGAVAVDPGTEGDGNITISEPYPRSPDLGDKGAPAGKTFELDFDSAIYPGDRRVTVVIPAQYVDGTEAPFMIGTDGLNGTLREAARNLAVHPDPERRIPPLVLIGITPGSERSREYDTVSDQFWKYITTEIIPAVLAEPPIKDAYPNLKLTTKPSGRGAYGCSSGAPAVMGMAWFGDFTRLLTYSGTFVALRRSETYPNGAWDYAGMIEREPLRPALRMFLHVSENDNVNGGSMGSWKTANEDLAAALKTKGYHYRFVYSEDSGHCDGRVIAHTLPDALVWLWRGYQPG